MQYWATAIIFFICACGAVFYTALRRKAVRPLAIVLLTILALNILVLSSCAGQTATPSSAASEMSTESAAATVGAGKGTQGITVNLDIDQQYYSNDIDDGSEQSQGRQLHQANDNCQS
jgi:uncharacterized membrane protein YoaK (UPF0700 family)